MNALILAPIAFDWTESKDGSGNLRWRVTAPNDHRAEVYRAVGDGAWCAIVDMRGTRDLGSKEGAMRFAEARMTDLIEGEFLAARRTLSALLPLTAPSSAPAISGTELTEVSRLTVELAEARAALDSSWEMGRDAAATAAHAASPLKMAHLDAIGSLKPPVDLAERIEAAGTGSSAQAKINRSAIIGKAEIEALVAQLNSGFDNCDRDSQGLELGGVLVTMKNAAIALTALQAEREQAERAEAEVKRLSALLEGRFSDVRLVEFTGGELSLQGTLFEYVAEFMAQMLTAGGARPNPANYTETRLEHPELGPLVLTLQRQSGQTPHALRREAEAERDALVEALHDAIVRPMGVVPASAETWYDHRLADAAVKSRSTTANILLSGAGARPAATHRHRKGGLYRMIARGRIESTLEPCVIYEGLEGGLVWVRSEDEFSDGRFAALVDESALPRLAPLPPRAEDHA